MMVLKRVGLIAAVVASASLVLGAAQRGPAADPAKPVVIGHSMKIASAILKDSVAVDVYLPRGYERGHERYPVLLAFMTRLPTVAGIVDGLADHTIPPLIAVSVDLSPSLFSLEAHERDPGSGQAATVLSFLERELVPWLDARYRTRPFRIGFGGSSSAIFCIYALFSMPDLFQSVIAAGPMFAETDYGRVSGILDSALARRSERPARLFFTQGDQPELAGDLRSFEAMLRRDAAAGRAWLRWEFDPEPGETHGSLGQKSLHDGLRRLFAEWASLPASMADQDPGEIRDYRTRLAGFFGYDIGLGRAAFQGIRTRLTREGRYEELAEILEVACEARPEDYFSYSSLGRALEQAGRWEEAATAYETAIAKAGASLPETALAQVLPRLQAALDAARGRR